MKRTGRCKNKRATSRRPSTINRPPSGQQGTVKGGKGIPGEGEGKGQNIMHRETQTNGTPVRQERDPGVGGDDQPSHPLHEKRSHFKMRVHNKETARGRGLYDNHSGDKIAFPSPEELVDFP